jgi:hypothetical protein
MTENQSLTWWVGGLIGGALVLVACVVAHDRGADQAFIDHLFDFHLDVGEIQRELEQEKSKRDYDKSTQREWVRDMNFRDHEVGTYTPPENNGNRD